MDFIEGLPKSGGYDTILVVVDCLTKCNHFLPLKHSYIVRQVTALFIHEIVWLHGYPRIIVNNRDKIFLSAFWTELFRIVGTTLKYNFTYYP